MISNLMTSTYQVEQMNQLYHEESGLILVSRLKNSGLPLATATTGKSKLSRKSEQ